MSNGIHAISDIAAHVSRLGDPGLGDPGAELSTFASISTVAAGSSVPFGDLLADAVGQVNKLEIEARIAVDGLITGGGVDVHQAMIASEKASMEFELALAVRNKAVQAYQSVMSMQF
jgi:flagellar hook-basal body complex protein FliE